MIHTAHPSECPHHPCHPRRDRPLQQPSGTAAQRYGISAETVRKWRKRGASDWLDRSARPHQLPWKATQEERAIVCTLRPTTNFPLGDLERLQHPHAAQTR